MRDLGIDVALTTIDDAVLRVGELLIRMVDTMKRDLLTGGYIQADETHLDAQTPDNKGSNHRAFFWQYSAPMKGVVFDFEMTRGKQVIKDCRGILHTDARAEWRWTPTHFLLIESRLGALQRYQQTAYPVWDESLARDTGRIRPYVR